VQFWCLSRRIRSRNDPVKSITLGYLIRHAEAKTHGVPPTSHNKKYPLRARALRWLVCSATPRQRCQSRTSGTLDLCSSARRYGHIDGTLRRGHLIKQPLHFGVPSTSGISRVVRHAAKIITFERMEIQKRNNFIDPILWLIATFIGRKETRHQNRFS
jgi:hypothetical protein